MAAGAPGRVLSSAWRAGGEVKDWALCPCRLNVPLRENRGASIDPEGIGYEVAIAKEKVRLLRDGVSRLGRRLGQLAMYFDAPSPSVEIIDLSGPPGRGRTSGGSDD